MLEAIHIRSKMSTVYKAVTLLVCSNIFMTFAWYANLNELNGKPWLIAAMVSWSIALSVFVPFSVFYMKEPLKLGYMVYAVYNGLCILHISKQIAALAALSYHCLYLLSI